MIEGLLQSAGNRFLQTLQIGKIRFFDLYEVKSHLYWNTGSPIQGLSRIEGVLNDFPRNVRIRATGKKLYAGIVESIELASRTFRKEPGILHFSPLAQFRR